MRLEDPESLVRVVKDDDECRYEGFQYLASQAWEKKTGKTMADFPDYGLSYASEPAGEEWNEDGDDLKRRLPETLEAVLATCQRAGFASSRPRPVKPRRRFVPRGSVVFSCFSKAGKPPSEAMK